MPSNSESRTGCPLLCRVHRIVRDRPHALAVEGPGGSFTYQQFWDRVGWFGERLRAFGLPPGAVVAIVAHGSTDLPATYLGARVVSLVPLLMDAVLAARQREAILRRARPAVLADLRREPAITRLDGEPLVLQEDVGYLGFSSGTQGEPKGIMGNPTGLVHFLRWEDRLVGLGRSLRVALLTSPSFDVVLRDMFLPLTAGGVLCVPGPAVSTDTTAILPWLHDSGVNLLHAVPTLGMRWLQKPTPKPLGELAWILFAGEPLHSHHALSWRRVAPAARMVNLYGPSETTLAAFWHVLEQPPSDGLQPVGMPLPGVRLSTVAGGRIVLRTPHGSLGYLSEADSSLVRRDGVTCFATQDRGHVDPQGRLVVEGRLDSRVKRHGVLVDLADIEACALGSGLAKQACCVQAGPEANGAIVLAVVASPGIAREDLMRALRRGLGPAMPTRVVITDSLPALASGKVDRRKIAQL